eukprot:TRINITY_DN22156_c0_g1_i1.p1 TRINITY_DN22156_c0_g1~~TRINITY_DN22156_c0_g1_i1.p1  ORF type:complete len:175 (+),score=24.74 TRINITY_DN22156_c0_g1_i1:454-978(+)
MYLKNISPEVSRFEQKAKDYHSSCLSYPKNPNSQIKLYIECSLNLMKVQDSILLSIDLDKLWQQKAGKEFKDLRKTMGIRMNDALSSFLNKCTQEQMNLQYIGHAEFSSCRRYVSQLNQKMEKEAKGQWSSTVWWDVGLWVEYTTSGVEEILWRLLKWAIYSTTGQTNPGDGSF